MRHFGSTVQGVHLLQGSVASFLQGWPHQKSLEGRYRRWLIWKSLDRWISHLENQHGLGSQLHAVCLPAIVEFNMRCRSLNGVDKLNGLETDIMEGTNLGVGISNSTVIWQFLWSFTILICTCCPHMCAKNPLIHFISAFNPGSVEVQDILARLVVELLEFLPVFSTPHSKPPKLSLQTHEISKHPQLQFVFQMEPWSCSPRPTPRLSGDTQFLLS